MKKFLKVTMVVGMITFGMVLTGCSGNSKTNEDMSEVTGTDESVDPVIVVEDPIGDGSEAAEETPEIAEGTEASGIDTSVEAESDNIEDGTATAICNKVLMGGVSFTGTEPIQTDNYDDGTYYYADKHTDGTLTIVNCATAIPAGGFASPEDMIAECIEQWAPNGTNQDIAVRPNDDYTDQFSYPAYSVTWTESEDQELVNCTAVAVEVDGFVYAYMVKESDSVEDKIMDLMPDIFDGLTLNEVQ